MVPQLQPEYRYVLTRCLRTSSASDVPRTVLFCMLNPSTADQTQDDPTIRRVMHFADREGYDYLSVVNLYAARSTNPRHLALFDDPIGPGNDSRIRAETARADLVVAAWGVPPRILGADTRGSDVLTILAAGHDVYRLGEPTKDGHPRHPMRLRNDTALELHTFRSSQAEHRTAPGPSETG